MLLVIDFDGTLVEQDTLDLIVREWAPSAWDEAEVRLQFGEMTLDDVIRFEFEHVEATEAELLEFLRPRVRVRPGLGPLIDLCRERFIEPVVVSSGFHELIEPLLRDAGLALPVLAHHATFTREGTAVRFSPRAHCAHCDEACKRGAVAELASGRAVAYVGDGWSDRCAAAAADLVFARDSLARHLDEQGIAYRPFDDFADVRRGLVDYLAG